MKYHKDLYEFLKDRGILYIDAWIVVNHMIGETYDLELRDPRSNFNKISLGKCNTKGFRAYHVSDHNVRYWNESMLSLYEKHLKLLKLIEKI